MGCNSSAPAVAVPVPDEYAGRTIHVAGAGNPEADGVYHPVAALPPGGAWVGPSIWKKHGSTGIHISHSEGCWWIGDYRNCTNDLYMAPYVASSTPPVGIAFQSCTTQHPLCGGPWFKGVAPAPRLWWDGEPDPLVRVGRPMPPGVISVTGASVVPSRPPAAIEMTETPANTFINMQQ